MSKRTGGRQPFDAPQQRLVVRPHEILTKSPLRQASEQMEGGWEAEAGPRPSRWYWDGCPNLRKPIANSIDLTGLRSGRLTVVGLLDTGDRKTNGKASWVVRCDCGMFETRKAKALRNPANRDAGCSRCDYLYHLRRQAFFDKRGRWPSPSEVER